MLRALKGVLPCLSFVLMGCDTVSFFEGRANKLHGTPGNYTIYSLLHFVH